MRVGIATDHGGFGLKEELVKRLRAAGNEVVDFEAHDMSEGDDYPDYVLPPGNVFSRLFSRARAWNGSGRTLRVLQKHLAISPITLSSSRFLNVLD